VWVDATIDYAGGAGPGGPGRFSGGRSGDRCVASGGRVTFATLRGGGHPSHEARRLGYFLMGGAVCRPLRCFARVGYLCYITGACGALGGYFLIGGGPLPTERLLGVRLGISFELAQPRALKRL
jgi:hypothetical protein